MSKIRVNSLKVKNYRSFGEEQVFDFPGDDYKKPVAIIGYNNAGKTNLMNCILYGIGENFISENTFEKHDLHNLDYTNLIEIESILDGSSYKIWSDYKKKEEEKTIKGNYKILVKLDDGELLSKLSPSMFGANKHYNIFYINFHKIKDEISTKKTSWGNLNSFLAKHIDKLVKKDLEMQTRKDKFKKDVENATKEVLNGIENNGSKLSDFIKNIKTNYHRNLRSIACEIDFGLPDYEDIFLQMMFKIGLNGKSENLVPIDHFGDGYISMFIMAVIQAIAEEETEEETKDQCLFLFEEPESFLHENHQEYFYKMVLCKLAQNHQVIYTTHSDKMIDIFDTRGLIRLEYNETTQQTEKRYPKDKQYLNFIEELKEEEIGLIKEIEDFNNYIKMIEPNLNKILFSKKVILVEGPNDLLVYKYLIEQKAKEFGHDENFAKAYLNFHNISIIPHHGKATAWILIELCKKIGLDYFVINDWDFDENFQDKTDLDFEELKKDKVWDKIKVQKNSKGEVMQESTIKGMVTTNKNLIDKAGKEKIHFNVKKLETLVGYDGNDKNTSKIWEKIIAKDFKIEEKIFPKSLEYFLELKKQTNL